MKLGIVLIVLVGVLSQHQLVESCGLTREAAIALLKRINDTFPNLIQEQYSTNSNSNSNSNTNNRGTNSNTNGNTNGNTNNNSNGASENTNADTST